MGKGTYLGIQTLRTLDAFPLVSATMEVGRVPPVVALTIQRPQQ